MSDKLTLTELASLQNQTSAINTINNNFDLVAEKLDTLLSRDGDTPNQMEASLDMNSNRITNLPEPVSVHEPARLQDIRDIVSDGVAANTLDGDVIQIGTLPADRLESGAVVAHLGYTPANIVSPNFSGKTVYTVTQPVWSSYTNIWNGLWADIGGYPTNKMFGNDTVGIAQTIVGSINIPAGSTAGNHAAGISGYGVTYSTSQGPVGVFGFGGIAVNGASGWGLNTVTTNSDTPQPANNTGYDGGAVYAYEADFNIVKKSGAVEPNVPIRGFYTIGASQTRGVNPVIRAIDIDGLKGDFGDGTKIAWLDGFYTADAACDRGINLGASAVNTGATNAGSQPIYFQSYLAGASTASYIQTDPFGNIVLVPNTGSNVSIPTGAAFQVNGTTVADGSATTSWTPTVTSVTGSITTVGAVVAKYQKLGKIVNFWLSVTITTNGTGATAVEITLPSTPVRDFAGTGYEDTAYGGLLQVRGKATGAKLVLFRYDNTYPGANGSVFTIHGSYEVA